MISGLGSPSMLRIRRRIALAAATRQSPQSEWGTALCARVDGPAHAPPTLVSACRHVTEGQ